MNRLDFLPLELQADLAPTVNFIDEIYGRQTRRFSDELASQHLFEVAKHVSTVTSNKVVLIGALLHDMVEDNPGTFARVFYQYDDRTNDLIRILTKPSVQSGESREERNLRYWKCVASDTDALLIKLADVLSNIPNKAEPTGFRNRFIAEKSQFLKLVRDPSHKSNGTRMLFAQAELALEALRAKKK